MQGEIDWWENPTIDLLLQIKKNPAITVTVKDRTGEIACMRFNHLFPPFNNPEIRRIVVSAIDQKEIIEAYAGAEPSLIKTDVGIFVPGTPMASTVGVENTRGPKDLKKIKAELAAAGYNGEKIVVLAATTLPNIWAEAQVATDLLTRIGFNVDMQTLEWGTVVQRRASKEPVDKGGWNIFYTYLGEETSAMFRPHQTSRSAATAPRPRSAGRPIRKWPPLCDAWFEAPDLAAQKKIVDAMQTLFWQDPPYAPMGMYDQPTAFNKRIEGVPEGWPQFYGLKKTS